MWLEAFVAAVELRSFAEAARVLDCDQSTISRYMTKLERWVGSPLFVRRETAHINADGSNLLNRAKIALLALHDIPRQRTAAHEPDAVRDLNFLIKLRQLEMLSGNRSTHRDEHVLPERPMLKGSW